MNEKKLDRLLSEMGAEIAVTASPVKVGQEPEPVPEIDANKVMSLILKSARNRKGWNVYRLGKDAYPTDYQHYGEGVTWTDRVRLVTAGKAIDVVYYAKEDEDYSREQLIVFDTTDSVNFKRITSVYGTVYGYEAVKNIISKVLKKAL